jgi:hypothetical protein
MPFPRSAARVILPASLTIDGAFIGPPCLGGSSRWPSQLRAGKPPQATVVAVAPACFQPAHADDRTAETFNVDDRKRYEDGAPLAARNVAQSLTINAG